MNNSTENFIHNKYGYCYFSIEIDGTAIIFNLYVEPEYRRKGHARKLAHDVIREIRESGCTGKIMVEAKPRENSISLGRLIEFYNSMDLEILE